LCQKLTAADIACDVMRNAFGRGAENSFGGKPAADKGDSPEMAVFVITAPVMAMS
jgi:hypothetical protein